MNPTLQELKNGAAALPASELAELVQFLLRLLDDPDEKQVRAEWLALAEQRMAEARTGQVVGIPAEEVLKTLAGAAAMKPVEFHPDAAEEVRAAAAHYEGFRPGFGADFQAELDAAVNRIRDNPQL
jgi:hypothetical protein